MMDMNSPRVAWYIVWARWLYEMDRRIFGTADQVDTLAYGGRWSDSRKSF